MSLFSDMQTKHFYALNAATDGSTGVLYAVKTLANSDNVRVELYKDAASKTAGKAMATTDIINRKLIKRAKVNEVKPTYYRNWTITAPTSVAAGTTYYLYFYLENMLGFGMQDRWDRVAAYTATDTTVATVMQNLALDLWGKLNAAGPIKNDFDVYYGGTLVTKSDFETHTLPTATSGTNIVVKETLAGSGIDMNELALRMHANPYTYNVTMSTGKSVNGAIEPWTATQKEIKGTPDTDRVYISAATKVLAMELYFLRNRGDLYDLSNDFNISILNETNTNTNAASYYTVDIDYAFSDTQGYTYHSDKQLSIAVPGAAAGTASAPATALMNAIVGDTVNSLAAIVKDTNIGNSALNARVTTLEG